jgi:hypothetical protein
MTDQNKTANFGIRVALPDGDPFGTLVGDDWTAEHWFDSQTARDQALADMSQEHMYSRRGDQPTLIYTPIDRTVPGG